MDSKKVNFQDILEISKTVFKDSVPKKLGDNLYRVQGMIVNKQFLDRLNHIKLRLL